MISVKKLPSNFIFNFSKMTTNFELKPVFATQSNIEFEAKIDWRNRIGNSLSFNSKFCDWFMDGLMPIGTAFQVQSFHEFVLDWLL